MVTATIPVTVAEDAAAKVDKLGLRPQLEQMLEHARHTTPHLQALRVTLEHDPGCPTNDPQVVIWAKRSDVPPSDVLDPVDGDWARWQTETFPPQVFQHVVLISVYGDADEWLGLPSP
jgi:hypothetical protein